MATPFMRLPEWQQNPELVTFAETIFADPRWAMLLQTLKDESPVSYPDLRAGLNASDDSKVLGRIQGYHFCLNNLAKCAVFETLTKPLEAVFEPAPPIKSEE